MPNRVCNVEAASDPDGDSLVMRANEAPADADVAVLDWADPDFDREAFRYGGC